MQFKYMRIQGREASWITKYPKGIFAMCWRMIMDGMMKWYDIHMEGGENDKHFRHKAKAFQKAVDEMKENN